MLSAFSILYFFLLMDFGSVFGRKIVLNQGSHRKHTQTSEKHDDKSKPSKNNEDQGVLKQLHQIYDSELKKKDNDLRRLLLLKQQYIVRNHIEEFEIDYALNFEPDWSKVDQWSSTAEQCVEIRRQKWEYIFEKHSDVAEVQSLIKELSTAGVNQSIFCRKIAEAYFILSHNSYVYNQGPVPSKDGHQVSELVYHPVMDKSLKIFLHTLPDSNFKFNQTEDLIQIPKSVYHKLLRKDAQISMLRERYETKQERKQDTKDSHEEERKHAHHHCHQHQHHSEEIHTEGSEFSESTTDVTTTTTNITSTTTEGSSSTLVSSSSSNTDGGVDGNSSDDGSSDDDDDNSDTGSWEWISE